MNDLKHELERARRTAPVTPATIDDLAARRDRKEVRRRVGGLVAGLVVTFALVGGTVAAFHRVPSGPARAGSGGSVAPAPVYVAPDGLKVPAGSFAYERVTLYDGSSGDVAYSLESWYSPADASGREVSSGNYSLNGGHEAVFGAGEYVGDTGDLSKLSLDAATLLQQMKDRTAPGGASPEPYQDWAGPGPDGHVTAGLVRAIGELLNDGNATPELKAALFRVLVQLDGATIDENTVDPVGRPAVEVSIDTEQQLRHLWFDPTSQQLLAVSTSDDGTHSSGILIVERAGITGSTSSSDTTRDFIPPTNRAPVAP